jgi:hypothetical protein
MMDVQRSVFTIGDIRHSPNHAQSSLGSNLILGLITGYVNLATWSAAAKMARDGKPTSSGAPETVACLTERRVLADGAFNFPLEHVPAQ